MAGGESPWTEFQQETQLQVWSGHTVVRRRTKTNQRLHALLGGGKKQLLKGAGPPALLVCSISEQVAPIAPKSPSLLQEH